MNPDSYNFWMFCKECNERRSVSGGREVIKSGDTVQVYAIACDHAWTLTPEEADRVRDAMPVFG